MSKIKLLSAGVALGASLAMGNASATIIEVAGVTWDDASPFHFSTQQSLFENNVSSVGDILTFHGQIDKVNASGGFCSGGGCEELTFKGSYKVLEVGDFDGNGQQDVIFGDGILNVYSDTSADFDPLDSSKSIDGTLFAQLMGHTQTVNGRSGDLFATLDSGVVLRDSRDSGSGFGAWDIVGGAAFAELNFNTGSSGADLDYTTSFQPVPGVPDGSLLFGTAELRGRQVPEPSILALLGIGLLGFGTTRRKSVS
ncbi:MAG: PEP-CTERM sorting domain-containing protein [Methylococcaceae bacterium]